MGSDYFCIYTPLISFWVAMKACLRRVGWSRSGTSSPSCLKHWARAVPPSRLFPPDRSTRRIIPVCPLEGPFRSGVTTCLMLGHGAYVEITRAPATPIKTLVICVNYIVCYNNQFPKSTPSFYCLSCRLFITAVQFFVVISCLTEKMSLQYLE